MYMSNEERKQIVFDFLKENKGQRFTNKQLIEHIGHRVDKSLYMTRYTRGLCNDRNEINCIDSNKPYLYWYQ